MFGAFRPSAPLSGGLLWKIPWRLSSPQKLRHRRRLRRVDNVVAVLDNALKRQAASSALTSHDSQRSQLPADLPPQPSPSNEATPEELSTTVEGRTLLDSSSNPDQEARRHGRGPREGEKVPEFTPAGVQIPGQRFLSTEAQAQGTIKMIERWKAEMPTEAEMLPRDKYTIFDRKEKKYRKTIRKLPKWTRVSQRLNPPGY